MWSFWRKLAKRVNFVWQKQHGQNRLLSGTRTFVRGTAILFPPCCFCHDVVSIVLFPPRILPVWMSAIGLCTIIFILCVTIKTVSTFCRRGKVVKLAKVEFFQRIKVQNLNFFVNAGKISSFYLKCCSFLDFLVEKRWPWPPAPSGYGSDNGQSLGY